jgi:hypothetical protein
MTSFAAAVLSQPVTFSQVSDIGKQHYEKFFSLTDSVDQYANGTSLNELADLFSSVRSIIHMVRNYISPEPRIRDQWELNRLSEAKERLAQAIAMKKSYYENNFFGIVTKYALMLFCMWNNGNTSDITKAEDVLLFWDSRRPVMKISNTDHPKCGKYVERQDFDRSHLDTSRYYNYDSSRLIELENGQKIDFASLR